MGGPAEDIVGVTEGMLSVCALQEKGASLAATVPCRLRRMLSLNEIDKNSRTTPAEN